MLCVRRIMSDHARGCIGWEEGWSQQRSSGRGRQRRIPEIFAGPRSDETVLETFHTVLFSVPWQVYCQTRIDELDRANSALECL